jgi:hypothetical protein
MNLEMLVYLPFNHMSCCLHKNILLTLVTMKTLDYKTTELAWADTKHMANNAKKVMCEELLVNHTAIPVHTLLADIPDSIILT